MSRQDVIKAISVMGSLPQPEGAVDDLIAAGFQKGQAHRIVAFFPTALARPVLEELGVKEFAKTTSVIGDDGREVTFDLTRQPEYVAALRAGREHRKTGCLPHDETKAIIFVSADVDAMSRALNDGSDVKGATIASSYLDAALASYVFR
jgi:hypothetical protein